MIEKEKIKAKVIRLRNELIDGNHGTILSRTVYRYFNKVNEFIDSLPEEPVSEDLWGAAIEYCGGNEGEDARVRAAFVFGAKWKEKQMIDKACKWIAEEAHRYFWWDVDECFIDYDTKEFLKEFRKAMEELL